MMNPPASNGGNSGQPGPVQMWSTSPYRIEHLTTWTAVGGQGYQPPNNDWTTVAPYVDWGITIQGPDAAKVTTQLDKAGIISVYYTDPNRQKVGGPEYTNDESTFAHDCSSNRILITKLKFKFYLMNPGSPDLYQLWINELQNVRDKWGGNPDYVFEDTADHINYVSSMPCKFWQPAWDDMTNAMDVTFYNGTKEQIIYNAGDIHGLGDKIEVSPAVAIDPTTTGGLTEACFGNGFAIPRPLQYGPLWTETQTQMLRMQHDHKIAICHANSLNDGQSSVNQRLYVYASYLLTYDPAYSIFSEEYKTPSKLAVYPEIYLVPHSPYIQKIDNISQLLQTGGTYARQYHRCDFYGVPVGECAFVVNSSFNKPASNPFVGMYASTMVVNGYGILDGGTAVITGPAAPAQLQPKQAVVMIGLIPPPTPTPTP